MSKLALVLRAMDAYERRNTPEPAQPVTCHRCGAVVEDDALKAQTTADGHSKLTAFYCRAHLIAGTRRLRAAIQAQREGGAE